MFNCNLLRLGNTDMSNLLILGDSYCSSSSNVTSYLNISCKGVRISPGICLKKLLTVLKAYSNYKDQYVITLICNLHFISFWFICKLLLINNTHGINSIIGLTVMQLFQGNV